MSKAISAILLDLDGTLIDSAKELACAVNQALNPLGRRELSIDEIRQMIGNGIPALTRQALAATGDIPQGDGAHQIIDRVRRIYDTQPVPRVYDGVNDTLAQWHHLGLKLIICTNKPEASARRLVANLRFDRFINALAGGDTYTNRKPHPDHLLLPLRDLGLAPGDAVMVGDSQIDAGAARDADIPFIGVSYGYALEQGEALEAYLIVERFADVTGAIAELARERGLSFPPPPGV